MSETRRLAEFIVGLKLTDVPPEVVTEAKRLFIDWLGSALAGKDARQVIIIEGFAAAMGPGSGPSEILVSRKATSPYFAALVNAAASHVVEQDGSVKIYYGASDRYQCVAETSVSDLLDVALNR